MIIVISAGNLIENLFSERKTKLCHDTAKLISLIDMADKFGNMAMECDVTEFYQKIK